MARVDVAPVSATPHRDIVVVGASAGGVEALLEFVTNLPPDLEIAVFIVLHIPSQSASLLPEILARHTRYVVAQAEHRMKIEYGHIYIAPPDHHLILDIGHIRLTRGPRENRARPAIDVLFRSAARTYGERVIAVLLSGTMSDGTVGMMTVRSAGGEAIAQDPTEALYGEMPQSAINRAGVTTVLPVSKMGELIEKIVHQPLRDTSRNQSDPSMNENLVQHDIDQQEQNGRNGMTSVYTCPDCGGVLWELDKGDVLRFQCHLGHVLTAETLLQAVGEDIEAALWSAIRSLTEKGILSRQLASRMRDRESHYSAVKFEEQAAEIEQQVTLLRRLLLGPGDEPSISI